MQHYPYFIFSLAAPGVSLSSVLSLVDLQKLPATVAVVAAIRSVVTVPDTVLTPLLEQDANSVDQSVCCQGDGYSKVARKKSTHINAHRYKNELFG